MMSVVDACNVLSVAKCYDISTESNCGEGLHFSALHHYMYRIHYSSF